MSSWYVYIPTGLFFLLLFSSPCSYYSLLLYINYGQHGQWRERLGTNPSQPYNTSIGKKKREINLENYWEKKWTISSVQSKKKKWIPSLLSPWEWISNVQWAVTHPPSLFHVHGRVTPLKKGQLVGELRHKCCICYFLPHTPFLFGCFRLFYKTKPNMEYFQDWAKWHESNVL